jgi:DNA-binding HxlR family transcriptional regulator
MVSGEEICPFQDALELLGRRHTLNLLWSLQQRSPRRFTELRRGLGLNPVTLTQRLGELESAGVLLRTVYAETPPRVEYDLTPKGRELLGVLDHLQRWSRRYPSGAARGQRYK